MCIYLGNSPCLNYDSPEHLIPAGLGGIQKLPPNYVSREFNNLSSKLERQLMRSSILSMPRQLLGPGKRGSLSQKKATTSGISVLAHIPEDGSFSLGYIVLGKPVEIPNISLNVETGEFSINVGTETNESKFDIFKQTISNFEQLSLRIIAFPDLPANTFLIGVKKGIEQNFDCFIACSDGITHPFNNAVITELTNRVQNVSEMSGSPAYHVRTHQKANIDGDYYRCCAKISFNVLAHLKGNLFVMDERFNPIRKWIAEGGQNDFADISPKFKSAGVFPEDSHQVLITKDGSSLIADVCFYNHFHNSVLLTQNFNEEFHIDGIVCDWKQRREYSLFDYLQPFRNP